ncbi:MAG: hypothetical protein ACKO39_04910, partial [Chthoniobacterales bacterium]
SFTHRHNINGHVNHIAYDRAHSALVGDQDEMQKTAAPPAVYLQLIAALSYTNSSTERSLQVPLLLA